MPEGTSTEEKKEGCTKDKSLGKEKETRCTEPDLSCKSCTAANSQASGN